jgi:hypothetical protein
MKKMILIALLFCFYCVSCVNTSARTFAEFCLEDNKALIRDNPNFNDQEKRLYIMMINLAVQMKDEDVAEINKILIETNNFEDERILAIYGKYGYLFDYIKEKAQTKAEALNEQR